MYRAGYEDGRQAVEAAFDPLFVVEWNRRRAAEAGGTRLSTKVQTKPVG